MSEVIYCLPDPEAAIDANCFTTAYCGKQIWVRYPDKLPFNQRVKSHLRCIPCIRLSAE